MSSSQPHRVQIFSLLHLNFQILLLLVLLVIVLIAALIAQLPIPTKQLFQATSEL
jgi:hypothetical protein